MTPKRLEEIKSEMKRFACVDNDHATELVRAIEDANALILAVKTNLERANTTRLRDYLLWANEISASRVAIYKYLDGKKP